MTDTAAGRAVAAGRPAPLDVAPDLHPFDASAPLRREDQRQTSFVPVALRVQSAGSKVNVAHAPFVPTA